MRTCCAATPRAAGRHSPGSWPTPAGLVADTRRTPGRLTHPAGAGMLDASIGRRQLPAGQRALTVASPRYRYLASIGPLVLVIGAAWVWLPRVWRLGWRPSAAVALAPVVALCVVLDWEQSLVMRAPSAWTQWQMERMREPHGMRPVLAHHLAREGDLDGALQAARGGVAARPAAAWAQRTLGMVHANRGRAGGGAECLPAGTGAGEGAPGAHCHQRVTGAPAGAGRRAARALLPVHAPLRPPGAGRVRRGRGRGPEARGRGTEDRPDARPQAVSPPGQSAPLPGEPEPQERSARVGAGRSIRPPIGTVAQSAGGPGASVGEGEGPAEVGDPRGCASDRRGTWSAPERVVVRPGAGPPARLNNGGPCSWRRRNGFIHDSQRSR